MRFISSVLLLILPAAPAEAQLRTQRPVQPHQEPPARIFTAPVVDAGSAPARPPSNVPRGVIMASGDQKGWISTIDGKRSGIVFSLGSEHVIRGAGLNTVVGAWITSTRIPRGGGIRYETVGSVLSVVRQSDTELVVRVTQIAGGKLPWSSSGYRQNIVRLIIRANGGGREFNSQIRDSRYRCVAGEPNCE